MMKKCLFILMSAVAQVLSLSAAISTKVTFDCALEGIRPGIMTVSTGQINGKTGAIKVSGSLVLEGGSKHVIAGTVYGETYKGGCCSPSGWSANGFVTVKGYGYVYLDLSNDGLEGSLTGEGYWDEERTYEVIGIPRSRMSAYCGAFSGRSFVWVTESYENCCGLHTTTERAVVLLTFGKKGASANVRVQVGSKAVSGAARFVGDKLVFQYWKGDSDIGFNSFYWDIDGEVPEMHVFDIGCCTGRDFDFVSGPAESPSFSTPCGSDGADFYEQVGVACTSEVRLNTLAYPVKFKASGLPSGVKINSLTGSFTGAPKKKGTYKIKVTATSLVNSKWKASHTYRMVVRPQNAWARGNFHGYVEYEGQRGRFQMSIASNGKLSGKMYLGKKSYSFSASYLKEGVCGLVAFPSVKIGRYRETFGIVVRDHSHYELPDFAYYGSTYLKEESIVTPIGRGKIGSASSGNLADEDWGWNIRGTFWQAECSNSSYMGNKPPSTQIRIRNRKSPYNYDGHHYSVDLLLKVSSTGTVTASGKVDGVSVSSAAAMFVQDPYFCACRMSLGKCSSHLGYLIFPYMGCCQEPCVLAFQMDCWGKNAEVCWCWDATDVDFTPWYCDEDDYDDYYDDDDY